MVPCNKFYGNNEEVEPSTYKYISFLVGYCYWEDLILLVDLARNKLQEVYIKLENTFDLPVSCEIFTTVTAKSLPDSFTYNSATIDFALWPPSLWNIWVQLHPARMPCLKMKGAEKSCNLDVWRLLSIGLLSQTAVEELKKSQGCFRLRVHAAWTSYNALTLVR